MATLTLQYETGATTLSEINDTFAALWGYQTNIPDPQNPSQTIPNPQTKAEFNRDYVKRWLVHAYKEGKRQAAVKTAEQNVPTIELT